MNNGYQNELEFVKLFNNKYLHELDECSQLFLSQLFGFKLEEDVRIISWKNPMTQKSDIFVKYKNYIKGISIKSGNGNSVHSEKIQDFKRYLEKLNIPYSVIDKYISYHYGYKRDENGKIDFSMQLSSYEYKELYQDEIDEFNRYINKTRIIIDMIDRFLVRGKDSDYDIDALVSGTIHDYVWILKHDLYDLILQKKTYQSTSPHIACMTIGPKKRNLSKDSTNWKDRYIVSIRWNYIRDNIVEFHSQ